MRLVIRLPQVLVGAALLALAAVGAALVSQHVFEMLPCPWCVFQRLVFIVIAVLALAAAAAPRVLRLPLVGLAAAMSFAGIAAALWQQFHASKQLSCDTTLADRIVSGLKLDALVPDVFMALASCADASAPLLGIPYAVWSLTVFTLLALVLTWALRFLLRSRS